MFLIGFSKQSSFKRAKSYTCDSNGDKPLSIEMKSGGIKVCFDLF